MDNFEKSLSFVFGNEGGESNHPADKGGLTNMGITQSTLDRARLEFNGLPSSVRNLTSAQAEEIYRVFYWEESKADMLPYPLCTLHFDAAVKGKPSVDYNDPEAVDRRLREIAKETGIELRTETPRPFGWWWQKFLKGVPHPDDATFNEFEDMFFDPCRGFMCWMITARMKEIFITKCCGDGKFWRDKAFEMFRWAQEHYGVRHMIVCASRNPEAYCRLFKCSLWKTEIKNGEPLYWFRVKEAR